MKNNNYKYPNCHNYRHVPKFTSLINIEHGQGRARHIM